MSRLLDTWQQALERLKLPASPTAAPAGQAGTWHSLGAHFGRRAFVRALWGVFDEQLAWHVELGLPGVPTALEAYGRHLALALALPAGLPTIAWQVTLQGSTVTLDGALHGDAWDDAAAAQAPNLGEAFQALCAALMALPGHVDRLDAGEPLEALEALLGGGPKSAESGASVASPSSQTPMAAAGGAFESIGHGPAQDQTPASHGSGAARLSGFSFVEKAPEQGHPPRLWAILEIDTVLASRESRALLQLLARALHVQRDIVAIGHSEPEASGLLLEQPAHGARLALELRSGEQLEPDATGLTTDVRAKAQSYLDRLVEFGRLGVSLNDLLGAAHPASAAAALPARAPEEGEFVLDLGPGKAPARAPASRDSASSASSAPSTTLTAGQYTDARLQRPDATSELVDVVLRHAGYTERRVAQVLSILLSQSYPDALKSARAAPCVVARSLPRERALQFRDLLEPAGARVLLVEPGFFDTQGADGPRVRF